MAGLVSDLEGFLTEISEAMGSTRFYDDIELSVEGIERLVTSADPSVQGERAVAVLPCPRPRPLP